MVASVPPIPCLGRRADEGAEGPGVVREGGRWPAALLPISLPSKSSPKSPRPAALLAKEVRVEQPEPARVEATPRDDPPATDCSSRASRPLPRGMLALPDAEGSASWISSFLDSDMLSALRLGGLRLRSSAESVLLPSCVGPVPRMESCCPVLLSSEAKVLCRPDSARLLAWPDNARLLPLAVKALRWETSESAWLIS